MEIPNVFFVVALEQDRADVVLHIAIITLLAQPGM